MPDQPDITDVHHVTLQLPNLTDIARQTAAHLLAEARAAITEAERLGEIEAEAVYDEAASEAERPGQKHLAVLRIMAHPRQDGSGKLHSYSSAEVLAETDAEYGALLRDQRTAARDRLLARSRAWAGRARAALLIAALNIGNEATP